MTLLLLLGLVGAPLPQAAPGLPGGGTPAGGAPAARPDTLPPPVGREAVEALIYPPLVFDPPEADEHEVLGVPVYYLHDPALPLVDFFVQLRGGPGHFPRAVFAPISALPSLLRLGGTRTLPPDSVDLKIDLLALQVSFSSGGGGSLVGLNALTDTFDEGIALLREMLLAPGLDSAALEVWRGQQLEGIRRREDDPQGLAYSEFNRLMFGDHPTGWVATEEDFSADRLSRESLLAAHETLICRNRIILGLAGDLSWEDAELRILEFLEPWPECAEELSEPPVAELRDEPGVFLIRKEVEQSTVIMAQPGGLLLDDSPEYFASRIADFILGSGGFTSRMMTRVRTEQGLAYGASSLWGASRRSQGLLGALTFTRPERTIEAARLLRDVMDEFRGTPPESDEVESALEEIANGYVFAFESAAQIVARRMGYRAQELPDGWLERYLEGLQEVTPSAIAEVTGRYLDPSRMTILILGDPTRFDPGLEELGPVYELSPDGSVTPWDAGF
ncbi:MAG: pitrilysin family protein [Gemmatimonadota bacterium]